MVSKKIPCSCGHVFKYHDQMRTGVVPCTECKNVFWAWLKLHPGLPMGDAEYERLFEEVCRKFRPDNLRYLERLAK